MFNPLKFLSTESKSSRAARLFAVESGGRARWTPRDYAALAREGYARNAIVYRAVRLIAESIGALSFVLYEGTAERDSHPLLDLGSARTHVRTVLHCSRPLPRTFYLPAMPTSRLSALTWRVKRGSASSTHCGPTV